MAEPVATLGIVSASASLAVGIGKATMAIHSFIRDLESRKNDLDDVTFHLQSLVVQLSSLYDIVKNIEEIFPDSRAVPAHLLKQLPSTFTACTDLVFKMEDTVVKFRKETVWTSIKWPLVGKVEIQKMSSQLNDHKMTLNVGLLVLKLGVALEIKGDTKAIRDDATLIIGDTTAIREETKIIRDGTNDVRVMIMSIFDSINGLRDEIKDRRRIEPIDAQEGYGSMIDHYFNELESFANKSFCGEPPPDVNPHPSSPRIGDDLSIRDSSSYESEPSRPVVSVKTSPADNLKHGIVKKVALSMSQRIDYDSKFMEIDAQTTPEEIVELIRLGGSPGVETLLDSNPDLRFLDTGPLFWAVWHQNHACLEVLLAHGAGNDLHMVYPAAFLAVVLGDFEAIKRFREASFTVYQPSSKIQRNQLLSCKDLVCLCEPRLPTTTTTFDLLPAMLVAAAMLGDSRIVRLHTLMQRGLVRDRGRSIKTDNMFIRLEARPEARTSIFESLLQEYWTYNMSMGPIQQNIMDVLLPTIVGFWIMLNREDTCYDRADVLLKQGARVEDCTKTIIKTDPVKLFTRSYNQIYHPIGRINNLLPITNCIIKKFDSVFWLLHNHDPPAASNVRHRSFYCALAAVVGRLELADQLLQQEPRPAECLHMVVWLWAKHGVGLDEGRRAVQLFRRRGFSPQQTCSFPWQRRTWGWWKEDARGVKDGKGSVKVDNLISARRLASDIKTESWADGRMNRKHMKLLLDEDVQ